MNSEPAPVVWRPPPPSIELAQHEVHVWRIALGSGEQIDQRLAALLSEDEHSRAERFHQQRDRRRFVAAHGALRSILARYLWANAAELHFDSAPSAKPQLLSHHNPLDLRFSLAHAHELALLAVAQGQEIGVDIEYVQTPLDLLATAKVALVPHEYAALISLPEAQRLTAFLRTWTCKEAYLKAIGTGLTLAPDSVSITWSDDGLPQLDGAQEHWSLLPLRPHADYVGALAVPAGEQRLCYYDWATLG